MTEKPRLEIVENAISDDPFDLTKLRVFQSFHEATNVKKLLVSAPIRKPHPQDFVRVHAAPSYRELFALLELKEDRETFVVSLAAVPELRQECRVANLFAAITRTGTLFLWPVIVPAAEGRVNEWHKTAAMAAQQAMTHWIRIKANMSLGAYEIYQAETAIPDPVWPTLSYPEIVRVAFRDRLINTPDHPVIKQLRGG